MSIEQARAFIARVHVDDHFRARVLTEADVDRRMRLIRAEGFDCTAEEIAAALVDPSVDAPEGVSRGQTPPQAPGATWEAFHPN